MSEQKMSNAIEAAAQWWADRLSDCIHSGLSAAERRDPANRGYEMAEMLMTLSRPRVTTEQVDKFRAALIERLTTASPWERSAVSVDYGPCRILADALDAAGVDTGMGTLPIKTVMWINADDTVKVRYGYGAEIQQIYPAEPKKL